MDKVTLSAALGMLRRTEKADIRKEQYSTDVSTATDFLLLVDSKSGFDGRNVADLGGGNGILGIGAALLGARNVDVYENDKKMAEIARSNLASLSVDKCTVLEKDFFDSEAVYDIVISNPPFGFQSTFNIEAFIVKAGRMAKNVFFIYKDNKNIRGIASTHGMHVESFGKIRMERTATFHKEEVHLLPICVVYRMEAKDGAK